MRRLLLLLPALTVALASPAHANVAVAGPGDRYVPPVIVVASASAPATFVNADLSEHDVVAAAASRPPGSAPWCGAYDAAGDSCPLFWSEVIGMGTTPILGLEDAEPLVPYAYTCSIHPSMSGTLVVVTS